MKKLACANFTGKCGVRFGTMAKALLYHLRQGTMDVRLEVSLESPVLGFQF